MQIIRYSAVARAVALCVGTLVFTVGAQAAGDRTAYSDAKASAKATYDSAKKQCDAMSGNGKDVCVAEAKAARTKSEEEAEAAYKSTPKAREHATHEVAEANYNAAKERCDAMTGNDKDVCVKEAKAAMVRTQADAKARHKTVDARMDAAKDKREADYKVATEKCDAMTGDGKAACVAQAKTKYGM